MNHTRLAAGALILAALMAGSVVAQVSTRYACEEDLIEVLFEPQTQVRLRDGAPSDLGTVRGLDGVDAVVDRLAWHQWSRGCEVPEERLDQIQAEGQLKSGEAIYNLNNIWRLRIPKGQDVWQVSRDLEALPGVLSARPVPKPQPLPTPPNYVDSQHYLDPASATPSGIDAEYSWIYTWGNNAQLCDIEYSWDIYHGELPYVSSYLLNPGCSDPFSDNRHGTAVLGILASTHSTWGTDGICTGATFKTCGSYYGSPAAWNVPGAIAIAVANLQPGAVILLEHQWDYGDPNTTWTDYIPIEWWTNTYPSQQSMNAVYAVIKNATAIGIHVVECGGNGGAPTLNSGYNTDNLTWYGNSGAIIVGAGGAYPGGTWSEGNRERLSFSSYGSRYDLQGWGENVVTTSYGDLWNEVSPPYNYTYTAVFGGTSAGGAIVAGAVAQCMAHWNSYNSPNVPTVKYVRDLLVSTGTSQVNPGTGHIGPLPNLRAAFEQLVKAREWVVDSTPPLNVGGAYGVAWGDYDRDGDNDLYVTSYLYGSFLLRNNGDGSWTSPFVSTTPPNDNFDGTGAVWGDYDNDGDLDLYLAQADGMPNRLFQNYGDGTFGDVTAGPLGGADSTYGVSWVDYDRDGDLDLYVVNWGTANKLLRNDAGWFTDVTTPPLNDAGQTECAAWGDYDNDGDQDVYITKNGANKLCRNDGGGVFTDVTSGPLGNANFSQGASWGDYDNDGDLDLYFTNNYKPNKLLRNNGGGSFTDVTTTLLGDSANAGYGGEWGDYDNDGDLDLYLTTGAGGDSKNHLFRNNAGVFVDAPYNSTASASTYGGSGFGDSDNDGDLDLYVCYGSPRFSKLFINEIGEANHWLHINLVGNGSSNRDAIGARVRIVHGSHLQIREVTAGSGMCSMGSLTVEFGLGLDTLVDSLIVRWPTTAKDAITTLTNVDADQLLTIYEIPPFVCGDANGDGSGPDIADLVYLVTYMFSSGPPPPQMGAVDVNGDGVGPDISDLVYLVTYMFGGGPAPDCL